MDIAPKIYVDFDDVLCETGRELTALLQRLHGRSVAFEEMTSFDLGVAFGLSSEELSAFMIAASEPELISVLKPIDGAIDALRKWHDQGCEIHVVTGRPPAIFEASKQWLEHHAVPHTSLLFVDKYGRHDLNENIVTLSSLSEIGFCFAVEDSPSLVHYLSDTLGIFVAVFDRPWNRGLSTNAPSGRTKRCHSWDEVVQNCGVFIDKTKPLLP
jgi:uncharacterized HAD superfamily protein